ICSTFSGSPQSLALHFGAPLPSAACTSRLVSWRSASQYWHDAFHGPSLSAASRDADGGSRCEEAPGGLDPPEECSISPAATRSAAIMDPPRFSILTSRPPHRAARHCGSYEDASAPAL